MLQLGVIEPSESPLVLVPKPDGSMQFYIEFLPSMRNHVDKLIHRVGAVKYLSTLDLTKGY